MELILRAPVLADEPAFQNAHALLAAENFEFGIGYRPAENFAKYLERLRAQAEGRQLPAGWVPVTFLVATAGGVLVGRSSLRHRLNGRLRALYGHIGYAVLPAHRRRGYATQILQQTLALAAARGIARVLVTCDETNIASRRTIEKCGGHYEDTRAAPELPTPKRRYWLAAHARPAPHAR